MEGILNSSYTLSQTLKGHDGSVQITLLFIEVVMLGENYKRE
jgi:hypothetical protein